MQSNKARALALAQNPALSDEEVIERVREGDAGLFEVLMRRHNRLVYRTIRAILKNEDEVEDAMQQSYIAAFAHLHQFRATAKFSTWLVRIAVNEALGRLRKKNARREELPMEMPAEPIDTRDPERRVAGHELLALLETSVESLPEGYRLVFMLRDVEGLDIAETAAALGLSVDVIKQRLHRARAMLRKDLYARAGSAATDAFRFDDRRCDRIVAGVLGRISE